MWISKKALLQRTGISYGQLYRWKREKLIPEEWFVKRSSYTGQETFFPEELILPRIQAILGNKEQYSLSELSRMLSGDVAPGAVEQEAAGRFPEIAPQVLAAARRVLTGESWSLRELSLLAGVTQAGEKLGLPPGKLERLTELALSAESEGIGSDAVLTVFFIREEQPEPKPHLLLHGANLPFAFDRSVTVAFSVSLRETAEALKINHRELFPGLKEAFSE